jgi:hypothetical protein
MDLPKLTPTAKDNLIVSTKEAINAVEEVRALQLKLADDDWPAAAGDWPDVAHRFKGVVHKIGNFVTMPPVIAQLTDSDLKDDSGHAMLNKMLRYNPELAEMYSSSINTRANRAHAYLKQLLAELGAKPVTRRNRESGKQTKKQLAALIRIDDEGSLSASAKKRGVSYEAERKLQIRALKSSGQLTGHTKDEDDILVQLVGKAKKRQASSKGKKRRTVHHRFQDNHPDPKAKDLNKSSD